MLHHTRPAREDRPPEEGPPEGASGRGSRRAQSGRSGSDKRVVRWHLSTMRASSQCSFRHRVEGKLRIGSVHGWEGQELLLWACPVRTQDSHFFLQQRRGGRGGLQEERSKPCWRLHGAWGSSQWYQALLGLADASTLAQAMGRTRETPLPCPARATRCCRRRRRKADAAIPRKLPSGIHGTALRCDTPGGALR